MAVSARSGGRVGSRHARGKFLSPESSAAGRPLQVVATRKSYWVGCGTLPDETDRIYSAILLPVTGG